MALAYFITFTTYGTWLHGTAKGKGSVDRKHNQFGEEFVAPNLKRHSVEQCVMSQPPYALDSARRKIVRDTIAGLCREKQWQLLAMHVRTNHVHLVVSADRDPDRLMSDMKARASRKLTQAGFETSSRKRWTRHGSTVHLFDEASVAEKIDYTLHRQGTPMAFFDGTTEPRTERTRGVSGLKATEY
jgi:REP element-mobilizing transposase RayT